MLKFWEIVSEAPMVYAKFYKNNSTFTPILTGSVFTYETNTWNTLSSHRLIEEVKEGQKALCRTIYDPEHKFDFNYRLASEKEFGELEKSILSFENTPPPVRPSIDTNTHLWYPKDLLRFVRRSTPKQWSNYIDYISHYDETR